MKKVLFGISLLGILVSSSCVNENKVNLEEKAISEYKGKLNDSIEFQYKIVNTDSVSYIILKEINTNTKDTFGYFDIGSIFSLDGYAEKKNGKNVYYYDSLTLEKMNKRYKSLVFEVNEKLVNDTIDEFKPTIY